MFQNSSTRKKQTVPLAIQVFRSGVIALAFAVGIAGCAGSPKTVLHEEGAGIQFSQARPLAIQFDTQNAVDFSGYLNKDNPPSQGGAGILYPGNTAGVFLVSVAAHALVAGAVQNSAEAKQQTEANSVLADYADYISGIKEGELARTVIEQLVTDGSYSFPISTYVAGNDQKSWLAQVQPTYIMAQDQRQIMLRATILLSKSETPDQIEYQNVIDVVSPTTQSIDPKQYWLQQDELRKSAVELLYRSLTWMITDITTGQKDVATEQKTYQYTFGGETVYVRGNLLAQDCDYTAIRNLRGWIEAFPGSAAAGCETAANNSDSPCNGECDGP